MAWVTSESYKKIVEHFLRTGKVTLVSSERNFPVEGFAMAAFDSNPSKVRSEEFAKLSAYYGAGLANNVIFIGFFSDPFEPSTSTHTLLPELKSYKVRCAALNLQVIGRGHV